MYRVLSVAGDDMAKPFASVTHTGLDQYELILARRRPSGAVEHDSLLLSARDFHVLVEAMVKAMAIPPDFPGSEPPEPEGA